MRMRRNGNSHTLLVGLQNDAAILASSLAVSLKSNASVLYNLTVLLLFTQEQENHMLTQRLACEHLGWQ